MEALQTVTIVLDCWFIKVGLKELYNFIGFEYRMTCRSDENTCYRLILMLKN